MQTGEITANTISWYLQKNTLSYYFLLLTHQQRPYEHISMTKDKEEFHKRDLFVGTESAL